jgi:Fe-S-cluster containining protein
VAKLEWNQNTIQRSPARLKEDSFSSIIGLDPKIKDIFDMIKEIMPTHFNCKRCGTCCKRIGIPWSELDPGAAADYLGIRLSDFMKAYGFVRNEYSGQIEPTEYNAAPCPFLRYNKEHAACEIYPVRPWICKGYPGIGTSCINGQKRS